MDSRVHPLEPAVQAAQGPAKASPRPKTVAAAQQRMARMQNVYGSTAPQLSTKAVRGLVLLEPLPSHLLRIKLIKGAGAGDGEVSKRTGGSGADCNLAAPARSVGTPRSGRTAVDRRWPNIPQAKRVSAHTPRALAEAGSSSSGAQKAPERTSPWLRSIQQRLEGGAAAPKGSYDTVDLEGGGRGTKDALLPFGYATLGPIAQGAFSQVVRARVLAGCDAVNNSVGVDSCVAVKTCVTKSKTGGAANAEDLRHLRSEILCLQQLQSTAHQHVANLLALHESKYETHLVLHYCSGGTLLRQLKSLGYGSSGLDEPSAVVVLSQVGAALAHLHARGVTHRDLKPGNVVYDGQEKRTVRLVDFGFAALHQPTPADAPRRLHTICGTPCFMAPELVRGDGASSGYSKGGYLGPPVDVWAFGCLAFETLCNRPAFNAESLTALTVRILKCARTHERVPGVHAHF